MGQDKGEFPFVLAIQIQHPTSLWKKIIFIARKKEWTPREVVEQAVSILYYHLDPDNTRKT